MADKVLVLRDPGDLIEDTSLLDGKADRENGFVDRAESSISFVDGTRTFTIAPTGSSFDYFYASVRYTKSAPDNLVIPDTEGPHYIYYEGDALKSTTVFTNEIITTFAFVVAVYWDATGKESILFNEERHGHVFDSVNHLYEHDTFGARFGGGLGLGNMDVDGNGDDATAAQFSVEGGTVWDEDLDHVITGGVPQTLSPIAEIPMFYRTGANGYWRRVAATQYPVTTAGTGRAAWNEFTAGAWQLTETGSNDFVLTHHFGTGDTRHPVIGLVGQAEYATVSLARAGAFDELKALLFGPLAVLTPEFVAIATVIWQTSNAYSNAVKSRVRSTDGGADYIDWRSQRGGIGAGSGGAGAAPVFLDSEFRLVDETNLLQLSFQLSGLTANREKNALDAAGTDVLSDAVLTANSLPFVDASGRLDEDTTFVRDPATGNVGVGTSSPGALVDAVKSQAAPTTISVDNPLSDASAYAGFEAANDAAVSVLRAFNGSYSGTRFGQTLAGKTELSHSGGSGLVIGTLESDPVTLGTNDSVALHIDSSQNVGIRTDAPEAIVHVVDESGFEVIFDRYTAGQGGMNYTMRKARGTAGAPSAVVAGDKVASLVGSGYDGSSFDTVAAIRFEVQAIAAGDVQGQLRFLTTDSGGAAVEGMILDGDQNLGVGTSAPGARLEVAGQVKITGGAPGAGKVLTDLAGTGLGTWEAAGAGASGWTDDGIVVRLTTPTDRVGVGTASPLGLLNVDGVGSLNVPNFLVSGATNEVMQLRYDSNGQPFTFSGALNSDIATRILTNSGGAFVLQGFTGAGGDAGVRFQAHGAGTRTAAHVLFETFDTDGATGRQAPGASDEIFALYAGDSAAGTLVANALGNGNVGVGVASPGSALSVAGAMSNSTEIDNGSSGASATIDWTAGNAQTITLTANTTLSFTGVTGAGMFWLRLVQDGTGSRTVTWPATAKWPGGVAPTLTTTAAAVDVVLFLFDGTDYHGDARLDSK